MAWLVIFQDCIASRLQHGYYLLLLAKYAEIILQRVQQKDVKTVQLGQEKSVFEAADRWIREK